MFAATYPERCSGLILFDPRIKGIRSADYPWAQTEDEWRRQLSAEEYRVTRTKGTEHAFSSEMCDLFEPGVAG